MKKTEVENLVRLSLYDRLYLKEHSINHNLYSVNGDKKFVDLYIVVSYHTVGSMKLNARILHLSHMVYL